MTLETEKTDLKDGLKETKANLERMEEKLKAKELDTSAQITHAKKALETANGNVRDLKAQKSSLQDKFDLHDRFLKDSERKAELETSGKDAKIAILEQELKKSNEAYQES